MKKILAICLLFAAAFPACKSNNNKDKKTETYREVNVKNVNGNIPDTTNAIDLGTKKDTSSVMKDSSRVKDQ